MADPTRFESAEALFAFDEDLRLVTWNRGAERLTGFAAGEVVGRHCFEVLQGVDDGGLPVCRADCPYARLMLEGGSPEGPTTWVRTAGGSRRRVQFSLLSVRAGPGARFLHLVRPAAARGEEGPRPLRLTPRQRQVLELAAEGTSVREVARRLGLAETTARNLLAAARFKLGARSTAEAVAVARELGLVDGDMP